MERLRFLNNKHNKIGKILNSYFIFYIPSFIKIVS